MKHAKKNRVAISAAVLAVIATTMAACSNSPAGNTAGKGGDLDSTNATRITALLQTGISQANQQNWSAASATFQDALKIDPGNLYVNYDLGVVAQGAGNSTEAISYYNKALAIDTNYTPAMYNEAILLEKSQPKQAIAMYQKIVSINPQASTAYLRMAFVQAEQGDQAAAKANDAKAISIDPTLGKYSLPATK
jgi:Tfp pilus assembly protein PilF